MLLTLYGAPLSPYVRAVRATLREKAVSCDFHRIGASDLQSDDYAARHPFRKIPALDVAGQPLFETSAIMRFIDEAFQGERSLQPKEPLERAHSEQWMSAANSYLYPDVFTGLVFQRSLAPQFGFPVDEALVSRSVDRATAHLQIIAHALREETLSPQGRITLGDILVGAILLSLKTIEEGRELLSGAPTVQAWTNWLGQRPSFAETAE